MQFHPWGKIVGKGIIDESEKNSAPQQKKGKGTFISKSAKAKASYQSIFIVLFRPMIPSAVLSYQV